MSCVCSDVHAGFVCAYRLFLLGHVGAIVQTNEPFYIQQDKRTFRHCCGLRAHLNVDYEMTSC